MEYNELVRKCKIESHEIMPYIVVVIDEYADLVTQSKLVEQPVMRLAQKARAAGIHLILATQRPSVDILTGRIKTNFPARIAFRVSSRVDSATIIDQPGAQALIGRGDMLFSEPCALTRLQCAFVDTPEVKRLVDYIASQPSPTGMPYSLPDYEESGGASTAVSGSADSGMGSESGAAIKYDALFADIARDAVGGGENFSTSYIQRTYEVGFVRAGRIMLQLERAGIVGPQVPGAKSRDVKITDPYALEAKLQELGVI
jgi:S-DNA-T family DNA segregation ATPase FtsK/SpoIIIE